MSVVSRLTLLALLGGATPALAQDSPWGESGTTKTAPRGESTEDKTEEEADEEADEGTTVTGERTAAPAAPAEDKGPELAEKGAAVERIEIKVDPEVSPPGGTVAVRVSFWTKDDKAIPGVVFDLLGKGGEVGEVTEKAGQYTAEFVVSRYAEDEAKLSVITEAGGHEMVMIEVEGDAVEEAAPVVAAADPEPKVDKEPKPPKEPRAKKDFEPLWLHVTAGGAGAQYTYAQVPDQNESGPLIGEQLAFGGDAGPAAGAAGAQFAATMWLPDLPQLGFQGNFRFLGYSVESTAYEGPANDWLYEAGAYVAGRLPLEVAGGQLWVGGRLGFHYDDFLSFQGCTDPGCGSVFFTTVSTPGLGLGPRAGFEVGPLITEVGYQHNLAMFSRPYGNAVDLDVGVIVFDPITVGLGFDWAARAIALQGKDSGEIRGTIDDSQIVGSLSVGTAF